MDDLTRNLLWDGIEDYTGLWDVAVKVQAAYGLHSVEDAWDPGRQIMESLLADGLIDLFTCRSADNEFEAVLPADRSAVLRDEKSWTVGEERILIWFATTDEGFDFYKKETGW